LDDRLPTGSAAPSRPSVRTLTEGSAGGNDGTPPWVAWGLRLKRKSTGYPGQIDFKKAETPDAQQKIWARKKLQEVIDKYNPGSLNPY
jgi:hypothetical protein